MPLPVPPGFSVVPSGGGAPAAPAAPAADGTTGPLPVPEGMSTIPESAGAELHREKSWPMWGLQRGIEIGGAATGRMVGAAGGALAAVPATAVGGPAAGVATELAGQQVGTAAGLTGADMINAYIDKIAYGRNLDIGTTQLLKDYGTNLVGSVGGELALNYMPGVVAKVLGINQAKNALGGAIQEGTAAKAGYLEQADPEAAKTFDKIVGAQQKAVTAAEPGARQEVITGLTGATPQTAGAAGVPPLTQSAPGEVSTLTPEAAAKEQTLRDTYYDIRGRGSKSFGRKYDTLFEGHLGKPAENVKPALDEIMRQEAYANAPVTPKTYSNDTETLIAYGKKLFGAGEETFTPRQQKIITGSSGKVYVTDVGPSGKGTLSKLIKLPDGSYRVREDAPLSMGDVLAYSRWAGQVAALSKGDATSAKAASAIEDSAMDAMTGSGLPKDVAQGKVTLDSQYRSWKQIFDRPTGAAVAGGRTAPEIGDTLFSDPPLLSRVAADATPQERDVLKEHFGEWATLHPDKILPQGATEAAKQANAVQLSESYGKLFPNSPLSNPKSLMYVSGQLENLAAAPQALGLVNQGFKAQAQDMARQGAMKVRDLGKTYLEKLGPVGEDVLRQVKTAKTPEEQASIVDNFFRNMDEGSLGKLIGAKQKILGGGIVPEKFAGVGTAVQPKGWIPRMMNQPGVWPWYAGMAGGTLLAFGHASPYYAMLAVGSLGMASLRPVQALTVKALTSDYAGPIMSSLANSSYRALGSNLAKATAADIGAQIVKRKTGGGSLEKPPPSPDLKIGPMSKDLERKQAIAMATDRGRQDPTHIDQVQSLNREVSKGRTPDIQHDLSSGRLASSEVRKLVDNGSGDITPAALFQGLNLPDSVEAFGKGTPDEQSLALAPLAQKINDEGRNLKPEQRRALMAQVQRSMGGTREDQMV